MRVIVYRASYGCDTGCCGHCVTLEDDAGKTLRSEFDFSHPRSSQPTPEDVKQYIIDTVTQEFGEEHVKDIDFENCTVSND